MASNNVQTTVSVGMDVQLAKRNAEALKDIIASLKTELKEARQLLESPGSTAEFDKATEAVKRLTLQIQTLQKVQKSATPAAAYESFISGDTMNSNTLRQASRGAKNRLNTIPYGEDAEARKLLNDFNVIQKQLNRIQAGFSSPFRTIKNELNSLSGGELQRLHQLLQQEQTLVKGNEKAWSNYAVAITKVEDRMREYDTLARQEVGAATLAKAQSGGFASANERDMQRAIEKLKEFRAVINDPNGSGKAVFEATNAEIIKLQANLDTLKQKELEARGEAMSIVKALRVGVQSLRGSFSGTTKELNLAKKTLEENLLVAQKGSAAEKSIQRALNAINLELQRTGSITKEVKAVLDAPKGRSFNELKQAVEQGRAALQSMGRATRKERKQYDELALSLKNADKEMKRLGASAKGTASSFDKAWSRLKTYIGLYMGAAVAIQKITGAMSDMMELSDKMGEVRKTTGFTADEVGRLSDNLAKLDVRTSIVGLLELSASAGQLGLKTEEDVRGFTEAANMLMVALPEMGREGATEMLKVALATGEIDKIGRDMRNGIIEGNSAVAVAMTKIGSTIDQLRANSAAAAPAITDFIKRVGAVGAQSGISIDQVAALGSTVDALGMRVEMSATALSRMIPAIRNNAFAIGNAIGVEPDVIRSLFDAGKGMEAILMILQHMKDQGMDADSIDAMLNIGGMADIMKDLNQQGARAGIVFAGLSQNVDELRRQLSVAAHAYEENIAIQNEYNKMNDTTAAKWARLKNELEEFFVSDKAQRELGQIIDGLRKIIQLLIGDGGLSIAIRTIILLLGLVKIRVADPIFKWIPKLVKEITSSLKGLASVMKDTTGTAKGLKAALNGLNVAATANVLSAIALAVGALIYQLNRLREKQMADAKEAARFEAELQKEQDKVEDLTNAVGKASVKIDEAQAKVSKAREALERIKSSQDGSKESADKLAKAETELALAEEELNKARGEHARSIEAINSQYGKYLGFMLSEVSSTDELAAARELLNDKLRESITLKKKEAGIERIEEEKGGKRDKAYSRLYEYVTKTTKKQDENGKQIVDPTAAARILRNIGKASQAEYDNIYAFHNAIYKILSDEGYVGQQFDAWKTSVAGMAEQYYREVVEIRKDIAKVNERTEAEAAGDREQSQKDLERQYRLAVENYAKLETVYSKATGDARKQAAANLLKQMDTINEMVKNAGGYYDLLNPKEELRETGAYEAFIAQTDDQIAGMAEARKRLLKEAGRLYQTRDLTGGGTTTGLKDNPWGGKLSAESTDYARMDANVLVARRHQMEQFVDALKEDTDVQRVLGEDKALEKAIKDGLSSDMRTVIAWYNEERLKIQEELKARNLTNEGKWRDPEKSGGSRKKLTPMSEDALAELERYYALRKERIEEARAVENMTEAEYNRRIEALEQEHLKKRSDLRTTFTSDDEQFVEQFHNWWASVEELEEVSWSGIAAEWRHALMSEIRWNKARAQKDLAAMRAITVKQLNAIDDIISKERPYDGITRNLQDNLTKMHILFADLDKQNRDALARGDKEPAVSDAAYVEQNTKRLSFLLVEAENAYGTTVEEVMRHMGEQGMQAWADEIGKSDAMQKALMAQLRTAYDAIQEAIKKEASLIKRQTDIWWADIEKGQDQSRKGGFEKMISDLGLAEDQVKRANSLIGAGEASARVADKLAIKQMRVRLAMQQAYFDKMKQIGEERIQQLEADERMEDAEHLRRSLNLAKAEEQKKLDEQRVAIANRLEESQNRLYTELKSWADLFSSSLQSVFEASNAGNREYYNELAKLNLTGKGGPGAGTYVVIEQEGTSEARAHYEYLDERAALERQHEIERQNAQADAWKKVMDDINTKMAETINDQLNAMLQNASIDANTDATASNTQAILGLTAALNGAGNGAGAGVAAAGATAAAGAIATGGGALSPAEVQEWTDALSTEPWRIWEEAGRDAMQGISKTTAEAGAQMAASTQSAFAKMTQAANLYGIAYQAMSNDNLSASQKFGMIAVQAAGQSAMAMLTTDLAAGQAKNSVQLPGILGKLLGEMPYPAAIATFALVTGLLGGLMGLAASQVTKSKSQIAQATGATANAGRLATGMLTYAEGNVNEFTDPDSLAEGRLYNVSAADGRTYRARYMGRHPRTHLTNGPEFHLSGERGREMIIDAGTTRQITMNEGEIWRAIQTLSSGGHLRRSPSVRRRGVAAFADGNVEDFAETGNGQWAGLGFDPATLQTSLDRNIAIQEALLEQLSKPIHATFDVYGRGGLVDSYDTGKKTLDRYGQKH